MDTDEIYFDEIKREVLPDGRIRYFAEKIVTEVEIPMPRSKEEIEAMMGKAAYQMMQQTIKSISERNPYMDLLK